jgi:Ca2+-dependent lipid-binding protein
MQLKARARITLKPLVETIPCLGAVNISLLEVPTVDLALSIINSPDLMAIPGLNLAVNLGLKMVSFLPWASCFCNSA